jgi:hypothetical protein
VIDNKKGLASMYGKMSAAVDSEKKDQSLQET